MPDNVLLVEVVNSPGIVEISTVPTTIEVTVPSDPDLVELTSPGPQGPQGVQGPAGPSGPAGGTPQKFDITAASASWIVYHGLGRIPAAVQAFLTSGELIHPDIIIDSQKITVVLANPSTGFLLAV